MRAAFARPAVGGTAVLLIAGCTASSTGPSVEGVAGTYEASAWMVTGGVAPRDLLAEGGTIRLELGPDGVAMSRIDYPPPSTLVGTANGVWEVRDDSVALFLEGQPPALLGPYAVIGGTLRTRGPASTFPFDPQVYEIVLSRTQTP